MKTIIKFIALSFTAVTLLLSCNKDEDKATGYVANNYTITSPTNGSAYTLNPNNPGDVAMTIQWSAADFGYDASTSYMLQILKASQSFTTDTPQSIFLGTFGEYSNETHSYGISNTALNSKLKAANSGNVGVTETFKMRIYAYPYGQGTSTSANAIRSYSQEVTFTSNIYDPVDEAAKLYVIGNFGAASTFADWDINTTGTSNSPIIYSALNNNIYEGFVYMNVATPQFKLANPTTTDLNIKGLGANSFTATSVTGVSDPASPFGSSSPGALLATTDISTGNIITPPAAATGASTYFIKTKWDTNQYVILKRQISAMGSATGNVAKTLSYVTDPTSPYYRMYMGTNINLTAGNLYIQLKTAASGDASKLERLGATGISMPLENTTDVNAPVKNLLKFSADKFDVIIPGSYTIVLDVRNSARYNLIAIKN